MMQTEKQQEDAASALAVLPPHLADSIFEYLVGDDLYHANGRRYWSRQVKPLVTTAQVCKDWFAVAGDTASARALRTLWVRYKERHGAAVTRSEMMELRRSLTLRRAHLTRVIIEQLPDYGSNGGGVWKAALAQAPRLQSLDLDTGDLVCPPTNRVLDIVQAASTQCNGLQRLMLPSSMKKPVVTRDEHAPRINYMKAFTQSLNECLKVWSTYGGLRHLRLTLREHIVGRTVAAECIHALSQYCPRIEIIDGFAATVETTSLIGCEERWMMDLEAWRQFSSACNQVALFDWVTVPFATRFFEIFGETPKPKLFNLTISSPFNWSWRKYFQTVGVATQAEVEATGYGPSARQAHAVFKACPNLEQLRVEWFDPRRASNPRTIKNSVDPDAFGDGFFEAVVEHCPKLTSIRHGPVSAFTRRPMPVAIVTLTDRSLRALSTLPHLVSVAIVGANITADGLFDLVINHQASTRHDRQYEFGLGDTGGQESAGVLPYIFYTVLEDFLERVLEYEGELPCTSRPVGLHLMNRCVASVDSDWGIAFIKRMQILVQRIKAKYPSIRMQGLVHAYDPEDGTIERVVEFGFATASSNLREWTDDDDEPVVEDEALADGVFVSRKYVGVDVPAKYRHEEGGNEDGDEDGHLDMEDLVEFDLGDDDDDEDDVGMSDDDDLSDVDDEDNDEDDTDNDMEAAMALFDDD